jgi:PAS domain S-box-containing protein
MDSLNKSQESFIKSSLVKQLSLFEEEQKEFIHVLSQSISGAMKSALFALDKENAEDILREFLKNKRIVAMSVYDSVSQEEFIRAFKNRDGEILFDKIPQELEKLEKVEVPLIDEGERLGTMYIYYDISKNVQSMKNMQDSFIAKLQNTFHAADMKLQESRSQQIVYFFIGIFIVSFAMALIQIIYINRPLKKLQRGLESFFAFLVDPKKRIEPIEIESKDEIGVIANFINNSVDVSAKMHREIAELMKIIDENVIISETDEFGVIEHVSEAFAKISGYSKEELIGKTHSVVHHPDMPKELFADMWSTISKGETWQGEIKNRTKDGKEYWVYSIIAPKCSAFDAHCGYIAIRQNITDKKAVEELTQNLEHKVEEQTAQIQRTLKKFSTLFDASPDSIVLLQGGHYVACNGATLTLFGYDTKEEFLASRPLENSAVYQEDGRPSYEVLQEISAKVKETGSYRYEWIYINHKTKQEFIAEIVVASMVLDDKEHLYIVARDITRKKELENTIKENSYRMRLASEHTNLVFWDIDIQEGSLAANDVLAKLLGYKNEEIFEAGHEEEMFKPLKNGLLFWETILHPEDKDASLGAFHSLIYGETDFYTIDYRIKKANGEWVWFSSTGKVTEYDEDGKPTKINGVAIDIDERKRTQEELYKQTVVLGEQKDFIQTLIDSQKQMIITTDAEKIVSANKSFFDFFGIERLEEFADKYNVSCICDLFDEDAPGEYLKATQSDEKWIDYVIEHPDKLNKVQIVLQNKKYIFSVTASNLVQQGYKLAVFTDITEMEFAKNELELVHKKVRESIEYTSIIQRSLIPQEELFEKYFQDYFTVWQPKDTVGGDIYLFEELRSDDECILMLIDCTGHGVPGAFVTMLVKAIERQSIEQIKHSNEDVSPAKILSLFNRSIRDLLKQESSSSASNVGLDGAILYYNKKENIVRFAGANIGLHYLKDNSLEMIKGDHHSVGYRSCNPDFVYTDHTLEIQKGMRFYLTTDGFLDQNGGEKGFPFGRRRFINLLEESKGLRMQEQCSVLLEGLARYQKEYEQNDDITVIGFEL